MAKKQNSSRDELFRNIAFVKRINIIDQKEDKDTSIQGEKKTYPK